MDFNAIYHRSNDNYCYPLNDNQLIINIKTGYDIKYVNIIQGDPFSKGILGGEETWTGTPINIPFKKRLSNQLWWTTTLEPEFKRLKYYFELQTSTETWYFFEDGFLNKEQMELEGRKMQCFIFPWMNSADIFTPPTWVNETIWYQIFPDRFCNGSKENDPKGTLPWRTNGPVKKGDFYGGDFKGIYDKLDYLHDLGITGLYLTPINLSPSNHKYDTTDYLQLDPSFGTPEEFKQIVSKAHSLGIRVMLDGVFNHSSTQFAPWLDVCENGPKSSYYDWFMVNEWPFDTSGQAAKKKQYFSFAFYDGMPKLNTNNPEVIEYFLQVCEKWMTTYQIDGLRLDVANEVSHLFCKELRARLKSINKDFYILGEIWHDALPWLRGDEFDSVMNYPLTQGIKNYWIDSSLNKEYFEYTINLCYTRYMHQTNDVLFNLLDSHDTKRLRSEVNSIDEFFQQLALLFAMPGTPCLYYGTEIALEGDCDPDCRRCMPWEEIDLGKYKERIALVKNLISLRKAEPLLRCSNFHFPNTFKNQRILEFRKTNYCGNYIEILINCSNEDLMLASNGNVLFSRHYEDSVLLKHGILFRKGKSTS